MLAGTRVVGKRRAVWIAIGGIALYTLLVGADAAVVRAAIIGGLFVLALYLGRQPVVMTAGGLATLAGAVWLPAGQVSGLAGLAAPGLDGVG